MKQILALIAQKMASDICEVISGVCGKFVEQDYRPLRLSQGWPLQQMMNRILAAQECDATKA
jgi:hypothetical protein